MSRLGVHSVRIPVVPLWERNRDERLDDVRIALYPRSDAWTSTDTTWTACLQLGVVTLTCEGFGPDEAASGIRQLLAQALGDLQQHVAVAVRNCNEAVRSDG